MPNYQYERPLSPLDGFYIKDDFYTNDAITDALVGELNWEFALLGNVSTFAYQTAEPYGVMKITTSATADGDGSYMRLFTDGLVVNGGARGGFSFAARLDDQIANNNFRIGIDDSITTTDPTVGIWVESDGGVITLECDSADHGDTACLAAGGGDLTGGTTMVVTTMHTFRVEWSGTNAQGGPALVELYVDDDTTPCASVACNIDNDEEMEAKIVHWQDSGGALAVELDLDFFELYQWRS